MVDDNCWIDDRKKSEKMVTNMKSVKIKMCLFYHSHKLIIDQYYLSVLSTSLMIYWHLSFLGGFFFFFF
jgi:hypothetical protein